MTNDKLQMTNDPTCEHCGAIVVDDDAYCDNCGARFDHDFPAPGEKIIFQTRPSLYRVVVSCLRVALLSLLAAAIVGYVGGKFAIVLALSGCFFLIPLIREIQRRRVEIVLTTSRLGYESGMLSKTFDDVPLRSIRNVTTRSSIIQRLFGVGDVLIDSATLQGRIPLKNLRDPRRLADLILTQMHRISLILLFHLLALVGMLTASRSNVAGQVVAVLSNDTSDRRLDIQLPSAIEGTRWKSPGAARTLVNDQLSAIEDSDLLTEYGLTGLSVRRYFDGSSHLTVEAFEFAFPTGSHGYLGFRREALGEKRRAFTAGRYLVILRHDDGKALAWDETEKAFQAIYANASFDRISPIISHLPKESKVAGSEKYIIGPVGLSRIDKMGALSGLIDFSGGVEIAVADYGTGEGDRRMKLAIVEYHTPQSATAGFQAVTEHHNALSDAEKSKRIIKRVGNYIVVATGVTDPVRGNALVDQVKYTVKVYWEGGKFTSIPIEFRPTDPAALEEAAETAVVLLRTFYGIGLLLLSAIILGVFSGWTMFYWRRYKRRKLGIENVFSDAGGNIRLNLDDYLLEPGDAGSKLLGKGDA
jgi:membrane protein YdbS with pleckstrin-like domain